MLLDSLLPGAFATDLETPAYLVNTAGRPCDGELGLAAPRALFSSYLAALDGS